MYPLVVKIGDNLKIDELTPRTGRVNMPVKVLSLEEPRSMDNGTVICEGLVGDETGTVIMSFWNDDFFGPTRSNVLFKNFEECNAIFMHKQASSIDIG